MCRVRTAGVRAGRGVKTEARKRSGEPLPVLRGSPRGGAADGRLRESGGLCAPERGPVTPAPAVDLATCALRVQRRQQCLTSCFPQSVKTVNSFPSSFSVHVRALGHLQRTVSQSQIPKSTLVGPTPTRDIFKRQRSSTLRALLLNYALQQT